MILKFSFYKNSNQLLDSEVNLLLQEQRGKVLAIFEIMIVIQLIYILMMWKVFFDKGV